MAIVLKKLENYQNERFPGEKSHYKNLENGQSPETLFITCSDSRVMPTDITESKAGELFVIRNAGNIIPPYKGGESSNEALTVEYAVSVLGVKEIVVCGHVKCGAMDGILNLDKLTGLELVHKQLETCSHQFDDNLLKELRADTDKTASLGKLIDKNVALQMKNLLSYPFVKKAVDSGSLNIYGWVYDFVNGELVTNIDLKDL